MSTASIERKTPRNSKKKVNGSQSKKADSQQYAISSWHNTDEIYDRLKALLKEPPRPIRRDKMDEVLTYFETKCKKSKSISDEAQKVIPGGVQHNLRSATQVVHQHSLFVSDLHLCLLKT